MNTILKTLSAILLFTIVDFQLWAQQTPKEQHKNGAAFMLQFFSTGDTLAYNKAISEWKAALAGYKKELATYKNKGYGNSYNDILDAAEKELISGNIQSLESDFTIYGGYAKDKIMGETEKDRNKKIKAGGKEYLISKFAYTSAKNMAMIIDTK